MTDLESVKPTDEQSFIIEGRDLQALLYSWLEELLLEFELKQKIYSCFEVSRIEKTSDGFKLKARAWGERYNPDKHISKIGIKAATYHRMEINKTPEQVTLRFILDI
jgi:SHS2 domain-containing protein